MKLLCKKAWVGLILLVALSSGVFGWMLLSNTNGDSPRIITRENLRFGISKTVYTRGETVTFWIKNVGDKNISELIWEIDKKTADGWKPVFTPVTILVHGSVKPGEKVTWHWQQKANGETELVDPGVYRVVFFPHTENPVTLPFTIEKE
ncbi:MAG: hypothetical protein GWO20_05220 [Candidatus Korarchaeota archaeon]|nr:hypothetical protein [Candidatus Korarchaeota archaeon]NIU82827.1 hypothetical protein [Candidatus Thorarchaeota archaeon]NIW13313.1 hypothetical protein [Candidatus Thorarchaeota archaeon]NIW51419.1 hypothetical protein [Candidatus Korarchaeota archaeon]